MGSVFETFRRFGPAAFVLKAITAAIVADALLLAFILLRRTYRKRYFAKRDARVFEFRQKWDGLVAGVIPYQTWRTKPFERGIVEDIALDAFDAAGPEESARLLRFLRKSGLIEKRIFEARQLRGWRRRRALVALGRTRAPEGIPALSEGLRDADLETRLAALRGLGRMACPEAGAEILTWVGEAGLVVPTLPLQNALIKCCAERPNLLLPYLRHAEGHVREVLGRVMGEVATPSLEEDLLEFASDRQDELRAAAARALAREALADFKEEMAFVFEQVVATRDRYGVYAYLTAVENEGLRQKLEEELETADHLIEEERQRLLEVLRAGKLTAGQFPAEQAAAPAIASAGPVPRR